MNAALSDERLLAALQAWPLSEPLAIRQLPGGMTSDAWQIESANERFIAKYAYTKRAAFEGGLHAAELVEQHNITCGTPLRTRHKALLWARQARFFAYCVAENVTLGGSNPASNAENLAKSRRELEYWLAQL